MSEKDDGDGNGFGAGPGGQTWQLAKLVGNYERFTQDVDQKLSRIETRLTESAETINEIKTTMATRAEQVNNIEDRVENLENNGGLSKRRRWQADGTTIAATILAAKEIICAILGIK